MGYCISIPACSRPVCGHAACDHDANDPIHPCRNTECTQDPTRNCQAFVFPEGMNESDYQGGGGSSGGGGGSDSW